MDQTEARRRAKRLREAHGIEYVAMSRRAYQGEWEDGPHRAEWIVVTNGRVVVDEHGDGPDVKVKT